MKRRKALLAVVGSMLAVAITATALFLSGSKDSQEGLERGEGQEQSAISHSELLARLATQGVDTLTDTDGDDLPDALENFLYGSNPNAFSTTENGIPDGWLARYGYDPTRPSLASEQAAVPPAASLPEVYAGHWPDRYRWTLMDVYSHGAPANLTSNASWDNGLDPREWKSTNGLPTSWLAFHGLPINASGHNSPSGDGFTLRDDYEHDTDPNLVDTDNDGLGDAEEVRLYRTDPRRYSTSGTGVPDGWLVRFQLDPHDRRIGSLDSRGKGMNISHVWAYNQQRYGESEALRGAGLDPNVMSQRGDAIPDGWILEHSLDPTERTIATKTTQCASHYTGIRNLMGPGSSKALLSIPDLCLTVEDAYLYGRPPDWVESKRGPWMGGLDPATGDQDRDGLPDAIEIRGWYSKRSVDIGRGVKPEWNIVRPNPLLGDTDDDNLTDKEEYEGKAIRGNKTYRFPSSDPTNPDTSFSGMTDAEKVFGIFGGKSWKLHVELKDGFFAPLLDPTRRDTNSSYLADGEAMQFWVTASKRAGDGVPYGSIYPGSRHVTYLEWLQRLPWVEGKSLTLGDAANILGPDGDVDRDGTPNIVDPSAAGDGVLNGWEVNPTTLRFSDYPSGYPRLPTDPANRDTSGDGLEDWWKLRHGRWSDALAAWDLDPAQWDSDGDGVSDADENIDGDAVVWHAYKQGGVTQTRWEFNNILEFQGGTNPRLSDENGDGVEEGWSIFWASGRFYDRWVEDAHGGNKIMQELVGDLERIPSVALLRQIGPFIANPLDGDLGNRMKDEVHYYRFIVEPDSAADEFHLDGDLAEKFLPGWPNSIDVLDEDGDVVRKRIGIIEGTYRHTFSRDAYWNLNPYLLHTSEDELRDAWKAFYAPQCGTNLEPAQPTASHNPDADQLTNFQEYSISPSGKGDFSTNPCLSDTDLDGLSDGAEVFLRLNPLDPTDAALSRGDVADTDGDSLPDGTEVLAGTDPADPDTDRDGLLDGPTLPSSNRDLDASFIPKFKALGIGHRSQACSPSHVDQSNCFYGEKSNAANGLRHDQILPRIPDGWVVYNKLTSADASPDLEVRYACSMPAWWDQSRLGVWWWGTPPTGHEPCPRDRDLDGLDDRNGEDPVPGASQSNRATSDLQTLMADDSLHPRDLVRAAQAWGECAGDPTPCFNRWDASRAGLAARSVAVKIEGLDVVGLEDGKLEKEKAFHVKGRLVADCPPGSACPASVGTPNRTIVIRLLTEGAAGGRAYDFEDGQILGVAFTDSAGNFDAVTCLCAAGGTIEIPHSGIVALGRAQGGAKWETMAAEIAVGSFRHLSVHAYASTSSFWGDATRPESSHPQFLNIPGAPYRATRASTATVPTLFQITSATAITVDAPDRVAWSGEDRTLPVTIRLRDASGGPVPGQTVKVSAGSLQGNRSTNNVGAATIEIPLTIQVGNLSVVASYVGNPAVGWGPTVSDSIPVILQSPLVLQPSTNEGPKRLDEPFALAVRALSAQATPLQGVRIRAVLGEVAQENTTTGDGIAHFSLAPTGLAPGPTEVRFSASTTPRYTSASASLSVAVVSGSRLSLQAPSEGRPGMPLPLAGRLTLTDGTPIPIALIRLELAGHEIGTTRTAGDGRFLAAPLIPANVSVGSHGVRLTYPGKENAIDGASTTKQVRFFVGTRIEIEEARTGRGQQLVVEGRLTSSGDAPLVGELVTIAFPWNETKTVLARGGGLFKASASVPATHELGVFHLHAAYSGSKDGTFGASNATTRLLLGAPSRLVVDDWGVLHRGNNTLVGRLVDAETGAAIAQASINVGATVGNPLAAVTDADGRVRIQVNLPRTIPPGPIKVHLEFAGDSRYGPAENETRGVLRVPTRLSLSIPAELGRQTSQLSELQLLDDRDLPVAGANITIRILSMTLAATTDGNGSAMTLLTLPETAPLGHLRVTALWNGSEAFEPAQAARDAVVKAGVRLLVDGLPGEVQPGQPVTLQIRLEDTAGHPVRSPLVLHIDGMMGAILAQTDTSGHAKVHLVVPSVKEGSLRLTVRFHGSEYLAARSEVLTPTVRAAPAAAGGESGFPWVIVGVATVSAVTAVLLLYARRRKSRTPSAILRQAQRGIDAGDPWAAGVLLAYRRLADYMREFGLMDQESQTPRGFAQTLVNANVLNETEAIRLVALVERARYTDERMTSVDARQARQVLNAAIASAERLEATRVPLRGGASG